MAFSSNVLAVLQYLLMMRRSIFYTGYAETNYDVNAFFLLAASLHVIFRRFAGGVSLRVYDGPLILKI